MDHCECCSIAAGLKKNEEIFLLGDHWSLNRNVHSLRTAFVLQLVRHAEHLGDLTDDENNDMTKIMKELDKIIREDLGAIRVHVLLLAEAAPHVHLHFIPRYKKEDRVGLDLLSIGDPDQFEGNVIEMISNKINNLLF